MPGFGLFHANDYPSRCSHACACSWILSRSARFCCWSSHLLALKSGRCQVVRRPRKRVDRTLSRRAVMQGPGKVTRSGKDVAARQRCSHRTNAGARRGCIRGSGARKEPLYESFGPSPAATLSQWESGLLKLPSIGSSAGSLSGLDSLPAEAISAPASR